MKRLLLWGLFALSLVGCVTTPPPAQQSVGQAPAFSPSSAWDDATLISRIDTQKDAVLATLDDPHTALSVLTRHSASFSAPQSEEWLVTMSVAVEESQRPRTVVALFDQYATLLAQTTLEADGVQVHMLPTADGTQAILGLLFSQLQGRYQYQACVLQLSEGALVPLNAFGQYADLSAQDFACAYAYDFLKIYAISYDENLQVHLDYLDGLTWNPQALAFESEQMVGASMELEGVPRHEATFLHPDLWQLYDTAYQRRDLSLSGLSDWVVDLGITAVDKAVFRYSSDGYYRHDGVAYSAFFEAMTQVFTPTYFHQINATDTDAPNTLERGGTLWSKAMDGGTAVHYLPQYDRYQLLFADDDIIHFHRIAHYANLATATEWEQAPPFTYKRFPVTLVRTDEGWRFSELERAW